MLVVGGKPDLIFSALLLFFDCLLAASVERVSWPRPFLVNKDSIRSLIWALVLLAIIIYAFVVASDLPVLLWCRQGF